MASSKEMELAIKIAGKVDSSLTGALSVVGKGMGGLTKTITAATTAAAAAVGAIATAAVNVGKEFETAMSQVQATMLIDTSTEEGAKQFQTLENAARECGATTAFSATEAAEGLNYLALAGYDAEKAATALPTVLKLAGAGAMDLAAASDMVTDSMSALQIEATEENLNSFADQMAQTASKANTSVSQLGEAILTVGATASNLAGGTVELNTALGILADNGIKGSEGGTHLRNVILSLQSPTDAASTALQKLGVNVYDTQGNMRGLNDIFGDLNKAMDGMSNADRDQLISTIFNKTDLTSANALLANCTDRWDELSAAVENSAGACQDMYDIQLDNLDGDIAKLQSGLSDLGISIYKDLNGPLREMTQLGSDMVAKLSDAYKEGGMAGMVGEVGTCLSDIVDVIADYAPDVVSMGVTLIENFVGGIAENSDKIADAAGSVLSTFVDGMFTLIPEVLLAGIDIATGLVDSISAELPALITNGAQAIQNLLIGIAQRMPQVTQSAIQLVIQLTEGILSNIPLILDTAVQLVIGLLQGLLSMIPQIIQGGVQLVFSLLQGILSALPAIAQSAVSLIQTLVQNIVNNLPAILQIAMKMIMVLIQGIVLMLPQIVQEGLQLVASLVQGIASSLPVILQMAVELILQFVQGIVSMLPEILQMGIQLIISLVQGIAQNLPTVISAAIQLVFALIQGLLAASPQLMMCGPQLIGAIINTIFSTDWLQVGADIISGIGEGILNMASSIGSSIKDGVLGFFGLGGDGEAESSGESMASSYASAVSANSYMATDAVNSLSSDAFTGLDMSGATTAGTAGATAFTTGLTDGMSDFTLDASAVDMTSFSDTFSAAGATGMESLSTGITNGAVTTAATTVVTDVNAALDGGWSDAKTSATNAMSDLASTVKSKAQEAANAVKDAFENLSITIPKPKVPTITAAYKEEDFGKGGKVKLPQFQVNWNAAGGIFNKASIMNTSQGLQGAGEAGPEALLPLDTLWIQMRSIMQEVLQQFSGKSLIEALIEKLQGLGGGGDVSGGGTELAGAGGPAISYAPVYNLYGTATKEDAVEAERLSQAEFSKMMKQWQKENKRTKF